LPNLPFTIYPFVNIKVWGNICQKKLGVKFAKKFTSWEQNFSKKKKLGAKSIIMLVVK